jgi:hypothetical protein
MNQVTERTYPYAHNLKKSDIIRSSVFQLSYRCIHRFDPLLPGEVSH